MFKSKKEVERLLRTRREARYAVQTFLEQLDADIQKKEEDIKVLRLEEKALRRKLFED